MANDKELKIGQLMTRFVKIEKRLKPYGEEGLNMYELISSSDELTDEQKKDLKFVTRIRNKCAHEDNVPIDQIDQAIAKAGRFINNKPRKRRIEPRVEYLPPQTAYSPPEQNDSWWKNCLEILKNIWEILSPILVVFGCIALIGAGLVAIYFIFMAIIEIIKWIFDSFIPFLFFFGILSCLGTLCGPSSSRRR